MSRRTGSGLLDVGDGHRLWWETVGPADGSPVVWLHGGPGSGTGPGARRLLDPSRHLGVLVDQRGSGRSVAPRDPASPEDPHLTDLAANTTDHLVADLERLREHVGVDRWVVAGGSWGSTLGLVYAQRHPERVRALVLAPVTDGSWGDIAWLTRDVGRLWPGEWESLLALVPDVDLTDPLAVPAAYARLLADPDPAVRAGAARAWCAWEDTHVRLAPGWRPSERYRDPAFRLAFSRLVTHYWGHGCFLRDGEVLDGMPRLADVPGVLVHGRLDVSGPLATAWRLHRSWPGSELVVLEDTGHGGPSMTTVVQETLARW